MKKILLDSSKKFYKGNMHCHSNLSDGFFSPSELKDMYKAKGYSFLAITDHEHFNNHSYLDDNDFITITSAEYAIKEFPEQSTLKNYNMKVCHLNLYAKEQNNVFSVCYNSVLDHFSKGEDREKIQKPDMDYDRVYGAAGINDIIKTANENGFFVCYNHPRWSLENYGDYSGYENLWGVEVFNNAVNVHGIYDYDINVVDDFHRDGKRVFVSCGDDNHNKKGPNPTTDSFGAFVMVNADSLSYENIIDGLLNGKFYSSQKPLIHELYTEGDSVFVKCSPAKRISLSTRGRRSDFAMIADGLIEEAEFKIRPEDVYFRIDVMDENGFRADTQCYYINEL